MQRSGFTTFAVNRIHSIDYICYNLICENDSFTQLLLAAEHIYHEQSAEPESFAERILNLRSCQFAVLVTVFIKQWFQFGILFKHLGFDAVYIRDDLLKPVVGDGCFTRCDVGVVELFQYTFHLVSPICEHKK